MKNPYFLFLCILLFHNSYSQNFDTNNTVRYDSIKARSEIFKIKNLLEKGEPFEKLVISYSQDPGTFEKGGILDWRDINDYVKEFKDNILELKIGEMSKPFYTDFGFHIAQLLGRKDNKVLVKHILIRVWD